jgi:tRNA(Ile)-lysidine synthase
MLPNPARDTIRKVRDTLSRYGMLEPGELVIVAVSGGPDSVCLLDVLCELMVDLGIRLVVAHYDHGLRPSEDESETEFVRRLSLSMNLSFEIEKATHLNRGKGASLEERARAARYAFLEKMRRKHHARKIALGHNLNDQAETVIMRLLRGSGPSGLAGIPPSREDRIIRPLIEIKREEVLSYLEARGLTSMTDSSNLTPAHLRNRIRIELLPRLLEYQPRLIEHLGQLARILREEDRYLDLIVENWVESEVEWATEDEVSLSLPSFNALPRALRSRVTRRLIKWIRKDLRRIGQDHILSVENLAAGPEPQGELTLPDGMRIRRTYDTLVFSSEPDREPPGFHVLLEGPGAYPVEGINRRVSLFEMERKGEPDMTGSPWAAYLDADRIRYPLVLRNFRPGDRFIPLGMAGHKKVKDFFIDLKVPSETRASTPILTMEDTPIWVCGYRIDERFRVTPETVRILRVTIDIIS